eukprot:COSAG06_NODE_1_length_58652_cov_31.600967_10_plen_643_part_00
MSGLDRDCVANDLVHLAACVQKNLAKVVKLISTIGQSIGVVLDATANGILEHHVEMTLACLWVLICRTELFDRQSNNTEEGRRERMLEWYQDATDFVGLAAPVDLEVHDLAASWHSGQAFCLLIASKNPKLVDWASLLARDDLAVLQFALGVLQRHFGAPETVQAQDFTRNGGLDEESMLVYLHMMRQAMHRYEETDEDTLELSQHGSENLMSHSALVPGSSRWRSVFAENPHEPLRLKSDPLVCPSSPFTVTLKLLESLSGSLESTDSQQWFEEVLRSCEVVECARYAPFVDGFRGLSGRVDSMAVFAAMVLACTDEPIDEKLRLICSQCTSSDEIDAAAASDLWKAMNAVGKFVASEVASQLSLLFESSDSAASNKFQRKVAKMCRMSAHADTMTAQMFDEFGAKAIPVQVFCKWCAMKPQVQLWTDWLGWWCRLAFARLSSSVDQYWSERSKLVEGAMDCSLDTIEIMLAGAQDGQVDEADFLDMLTEIGIPATVTVTRMYRLFDPTVQGQPDARVVQAALALLGPESQIEKLEFIVRAALAEPEKTRRKLVDSVMQPFALVAREVVVSSVASFGGLTCAQTKDGKEVLVDACRGLDEYVDRLSTAVLKNLGGEAGRVNFDDFSAAFQAVPNVSRWMDT